jgi:hypothetical protein
MSYYTAPMPISVRLPPKVEQKLAEYCASQKVTKSEAVKRALEQLLAQAPLEPDPYRASARFRGSDKRQGNTAMRSKEILRAHFRNKTSLG